MQLLRHAFLGAALAAFAPALFAQLSANPSSVTLPAGVSNTAYNPVSLGNLTNITGGSGFRTFAVTSPPLPAGLVVNSSSGVISGTPVVPAGTYNSVIRVTDSISGFADIATSITITSTPFDLQPSTITDWTVNQPYFIPVTASGGAGFYTYSGGNLPNPPGLNLANKLTCPVTNGPLVPGTFYRGAVGLVGGNGSTQFLSDSSLPSFFTLDPNTGTLSGTPIGSGTFTFKLSATDSAGLGVTRQCSVTVTPAGGPGPAIACPLPYASRNSSYVSGLSVSNSVSAPTFSFTGTLPPGLTFNSSGTLGGTPTTTGLYSFSISSPGLTTQACSIQVFSPPLSASGAAIYGVPTTPGTYTMLVNASDEVPNTAARSYTFTINPTLSLASPTYPSATVGVPYSTNATSAGRTGGTPLFLYSLTNSTQLPPGLTLQWDGTISGTPTANGIFNFTILVTDLSGATATASASITVGSSNSPITIVNPPSLPVFVRFTTVGPYSFGATGATPPYTWSVSNGQLPPGLNFNSAGVLNGFPNTTGNFTFTVQAASGNIIGSRTYSTTVTDFTCPASSANIGQSYTSSPTITPFIPASYAITSGSLPEGLSLNPNTGAIFGTPVVDNSLNFTLTATDSGGRTVSRTCAIVVNPTILLSSPRTTARQGQAYSSSLSAFGGTQTLAFSITNGALPPGLTLAPATGSITGTPTSAGTYAFRARAQASSGAFTQKDLAITVLPRLAPLALRCPVPLATQGQVYYSSAGFSSPTPATYSLTGTLPAGLTLNSSTGIISGTVTATPAAYNFTLSATPSGGTAVSTACSIQVDYYFPPFPTIIQCPDQDDLVVGEPYASPFIPFAGFQPYNFSLNDSSLPPGLSLNSSTGVVSGTPTTAGNYSYSVRLDNGDGFNYAVCQVNIATASLLQITNTALPGGILASPYQASLQAAGGVTPYTFTALDPLPSGLSLSPNGLISGAPSVLGSFTIRFQVTDYLQATAIKPLTITINPPNTLRFVTTSLNFGTVAVPYSQSIQAEGGTPPYSFSVRTGPLPDGLSLVGNVISGSPSTSGLYQFVLGLTDSAGGNTERLFQLAVGAGSFRLGCPLYTAELGVPYSSAANILGGTSPYTFSISSGTLPPGLQLNTATGFISGTPTALGVSNFVFGVSDAAKQRTQTSCNIGVINGALRILTDSPLTGPVSIPFTGRITAGGGQPPYTFALQGALPPGLTFSADGTITGTPTRTGTFPFTVTVTDAARAVVPKQFQFIVTGSDLSGACPTNANQVTAGLPYTGVLGISGGTPPYTVVISTGALPPGLTLAGQTISGTPVPPTSQNYPVTFQITDGTRTTVSTACVFGATVLPLVITTDTLPGAQVGSVYGSTVIATGGVPPYRFSISAGSLPPALQLDPAFGTLDGLPLLAGNFGFTATVTDSQRNKASRDLSIAVGGGTLNLTLTPNSLPDGQVGVPYSASFDASGGKAPYRFAVSGSLPAGLTLANGTISGTPTDAGSASVQAGVTDATGQTASRTYNFRIKPNDAGTVIITTLSLPDGKVDQPYSAGLAASGGTGPYTWSLSEARIPPGVSFDVFSGSFTGTPTAPGQFRVTVQVRDAAGDTARRSYGFEIRPDGVAPLTLTTLSVPNATLGLAYSSGFAATGGVPPYRFSINGDLPAGLSFASNGTISGTPTTLGTNGFQVTVEDSLGLRDTKPYNITVGFDSRPALSVTGLPTTLGPNASAPFSITLGNPYAVPITGQLVLTFTPDPGHGTDDPNFQFTNGSRIITFNIPPNSTTVPNLGLRTGTLAGTITITSTYTFGGTSFPGTSFTTTVPRSAPVLTSATISRSGGTVTLDVIGSTSTRQLNEARLTVNVNSSVDVTGGTSFTVNIAAAMQAYFATAASVPFGGQFRLTLPFTVTGDPASISSITVQVTNSVGASNTLTAN